MDQQELRFPLRLQLFAALSPPIYIDRQHYFSADGTAEVAVVDVSAAGDAGAVGTADVADAAFAMDTVDDSGTYGADVAVVVSASVAAADVFSVVVAVVVSVVDFVGTVIAMAVVVDVSVGVVVAGYAAVALAVAVAVDVVDAALTSKHGSGPDLAPSFHVLIPSEVTLTSDMAFSGLSLVQGTIKRNQTAVLQPLNSRE